MLEDRSNMLADRRTADRSNMLADRSNMRTDVTEVTCYRRNIFGQK